MKRITIILLGCFITTIMYSQTISGVKSYTQIEKLDGVYFAVETDKGEELILKVSDAMDTGFSIYADETYCLIVSKVIDQKYCMVSAAYKQNGSWIQDYENRSLYYMDTGISTTFLKDVSIIDGTTLHVEYEIDFAFSNEEFIETEVSLYAYGMYDHHIKNHTSTFFLKDKKQQQASVRKGPIYEEYIKQSRDK